MPSNESVNISIDYLPNPVRRWGPDGKGNQRPPCEAIQALLATNAEHLEAFVHAAAQFVGPVLAGVPLTAADDDPAPRWNQNWLPASDAVSIVTAIGGAGRAHKPATYLEIGSGHSTRFARRTIERLGLPTRLVSIDPQPRAEIDAICDTVVRDRLEDTDLGVFDTLVTGDVVFFDGSHRCLQNSDVTVFFLEVIPRLAPGVLIGVHDVFWPSDYPPGFAGRWYSEQYILGAYLLGLGSRARIHMATHTLAEPLRDWLLSPIPEDVRTKVRNPGGASLWFEALAG
ncbi:MAG: hypothetical protein ACI89L_002322 [Phycisphaerales bacterium]|jgi:hypothetical protein